MSQAASVATSNSVSGFEKVSNFFSNCLDSIAIFARLVIQFHFISVPVFILVFEAGRGVDWMAEAILIGNAYIFGLLAFGFFGLILDAIAQNKINPKVGMIIYMSLLYGVFGYVLLNQSQCPNFLSWAPRKVIVWNGKAITVSPKRSDFKAPGEPVVLTQKLSGQETTRRMGASIQVNVGVKTEVLSQSSQNIAYAKFVEEYTKWMNGDAARLVMEEALAEQEKNPQASFSATVLAVIEKQSASNRYIFITAVNPKDPVRYSGSSGGVEE